MYRQAHHAISLFYTQLIQDFINLNLKIIFNWDRYKKIEK